MAYEVLALKYRPKVFEDLVGQEAVTRTLTHAIQQNRIAHAFLFAGVRGVGKTTTARILAKALNCASGPIVRPCGECPACVEIARGSSFDVLEIDGASNNGVAEVRDIIEASRYAPSRDRFKIYIIDEVHMLTTQAFNALLKTLEEPPPSVKFIFATTEYHKIPDTILSRCQEFEFRTVSAPEIAGQLRRIADAEGIRVSEAALAMVARAAEGSLRDGVSALDQVIAATGTDIEEANVTEILGLIERDLLRDTARAVVDRDTEKILRIVDELVRGGRDLRFFTSSLMQYLRDILVLRVAPRAEELLEIPGETTDLEALARELTEEDLLRALEVLTQVEDGLRTSPEPRFHLEMALLKISQLRRLASFDELLARFEALVSGRPVPPSSGPAPERSPVSRKSEPDRPRPVEKPSERKSEPEATASEPEPPSALEPEASSSHASPDEPDDGPPPSDAGRDEGLVARLSERLKTSKPMLHAIVSRHHRAEVDDSRLKLLFLPAQRVLAEQLQQKSLTSLVEEQLSELAGKKIAIAVEILETSPEPPASAPEPTRGSELGASRAEAIAKPGEDLRAKAAKDPLVQRFVETFQGEVEDVRTTDH